MALYDNKYWLLSHIRNSFISTDDTGMCELIMANEEGLRKQLKQRLDFYPDEEESEDEDDLSHESYDLQLDLDFPVANRTDTAARLEKLEHAKKKVSRMKHVKWETNKSELTQDQLDEMFVKKEPERKHERPQSLFSKTFKQYRMLPSNPYIEYSKFDGSGQVNVATKKYRIFLTMLPEHQRNYPLSICCIATAKIQELVGLILLRCSTVYEDHLWKPVAVYGLYITEDDGEVDRDFPCLDPRENIAKFGFTCLGLVEHSDVTKSVSFGASETLTIRKSFEDHLNKKSKDVSRVDQEKQISSDLQMLDIHKKAMEAPLYKSYQVSMINKMRTKIDIHLGISGEKIEIDPIQKNTKFSFSKQKPINHDMDMIASCEVIDNKSSKTTFKIIYQQVPGNGNSTPENTSATTASLHLVSSYKSYEFEVDHSTANEIVHKVNLILELRSSSIRKEYLAAKERKYYKKKSLA